MFLYLLIVVSFPLMVGALIVLDEYLMCYLMVQGTRAFREHGNDLPQIWFHGPPIAGMCINTKVHSSNTWKTYIDLDKSNQPKGLDPNVEDRCRYIGGSTNARLRVYQNTRPAGMTWIMSFIRIITISSNSVNPAILHQTDECKNARQTKLQNCPS